MTTYPLPTLAAQITPTGISAPTYADIFASLQASFRQIFGSDAYIEPDSQDGQWIGVIAAALNDCNAAAIAAYNARSPVSAQGVGLSGVVKINGVTRAVATLSTATLTIVGQTFTEIDDGKARDAAGNAWSLPSSVIIPSGGSIDVLATCDTAGAVTADPGTITQIATPTLGWQSVTNAGAATPGAAVEDDATLRKRQAESVALPALSPFDAVIAAVSAVPGVTRMAPYENDTKATDANGLPANSVTFVVEGGDDTAVAAAIASKKTPGGYTNGTTTVNIDDQAGVPRPIRFYRPTDAVIHVAITIKALDGYTTTIGTELTTAIAAFINALPIGTDVLLTRLYLPALLSGGTDSQAYEITALTIAKNGGSQGTADLVIDFNEAPTCDATTDIVLTVT